MRKDVSPALLVAERVKWYDLPLVRGVVSENGSMATQREVEHKGGVVSGSGLKGAVSSL